MQTRYLYDLKEPKLPAAIGRKAANLRFLIRHKFPVPPSWVCTWDAHLDYLSAGPSTLGRLRSEVAERLAAGRAYAVRSSANLEDDSRHSFAGQFSSYLDVRGPDAILASIESVWKSAHSGDVGAYLEHHGTPSGYVRMAVVLQEMVKPVVSGVSFSRNPMTGLDEVVVEAVPGSGVALVQSGVSPQRWISKWGAWLQKPQGDDIPLALIEQVVRGTKAIAKAFGKPVDLEWVYDGTALHWVQAREITALDVPIYSHRIPREFLPGIIKPLIWSVNVPLVNGAWVRLFTELIGHNGLDPLTLAGHFHYRAYFNMGAIGQIFEMLGMPRESLELLLGLELEGPEKPTFRPGAKTYALLPKMLRFAADKVRIERRVQSYLPAARAGFAALPDGPLHQVSEVGLLEAVDRNYGLAQEAAYYNIVVPLMAMLYSRLLKGQLVKAGVDFEALDLTGGMPEMEQFDPNLHLARLHEHYHALAPDVQALVAGGLMDDLAYRPEAAPFLKEVISFLEHFGHLSDSGNDFSATPWRERPDLVLRMAAAQTPVGARQRRPQRFESLDLPAVRRSVARPFYQRARRYRLHREAVSSLYTYGYGRLRPYFLALGDRLVRRGLLDDREDIFYLYLDEVRGIVRGGTHPDRPQELVARRKAEIERVRDIQPPETIYGEVAPPVDTGVGSTLQGIPTSRGHYTGPAKVLRGIEDLGLMESGDVLVIPYSDVGWTPLFAKAGAVVAESGGILSHSSIIAREYGIPAVVSVLGACQVLDHKIVTVDGYHGQVRVHEPPAPGAGGEADQLAPSDSL
ncbi:MAG TPA: PEP/pyruvate-binding domain-containing protein [Anaerolineae bacterium]|nr:PEP/pyruvate-binding domain-containing protein [Anaerolineae bacterium]